MAQQTPNKKLKAVKYKSIRLDELKFDQGDSFFARGQFGDVKRAKWNEKEVAVKCFTLADRKGGFNEELTNLSILQGHKTIVKMHGACVSEHPFIVLEFAPLSLEKVIHELKKEFHYRADHVMSWAHQSAVGLDYIHQKNLLHRDIKPSNVLLFDKGRVLKLCDFGTVKQLEHTLTNAVGTIRYMAPEVIRGRYYTDRCDVFSFGMMVWEMLARKRPMVLGTQRGNNMAILYAMANGQRPPRLSNVPKAVAEMIDHCWDEESHKRPTMCEIEKKLSHLCQFVEIGKPLIPRRKPKLQGGGGGGGGAKSSSAASRSKAEQLSSDQDTQSSSMGRLKEEHASKDQDSSSASQSAASSVGQPSTGPALTPAHTQPSPARGHPIAMSGGQGQGQGQSVDSEEQSSPSAAAAEKSVDRSSSEMGGQTGQSTPARAHLQATRPSAQYSAQGGQSSIPAASVQGTMPMSMQAGQSAMPIFMQGGQSGAFSAAGGRHAATPTEQSTPTAGGGGGLHYQQSPLTATAAAAAASGYHNHAAPHQIPQQPPIPSMESFTQDMAQLQLDDQARAQPYSVSSQHRHRLFTSPVTHVQKTRHQMDFRKQVSTPATSAPYQGSGTSADPNASFPPNHFLPGTPGTPPRQSNPLTPPQYYAFQTRFPRAVNGYPRYIPGLHQDLQPIIPNESNPESVELFLQYKLYADEISAANAESYKLWEEAANLEREIQEDEVKLKGKEAGVQRDYHNKKAQQERLMKELETLQQTYDRLRMENSQLAS